jgi:5-methylcytosine-specific restriction enzyme subunit McrC
LIIEILPKADNREETDENKSKWQNALLVMLRECRLLKVKSLTEANLQLKSLTLIDLYLKAFIEETTAIVHRGLVKKYRCNEGNLYKLKGRILFEKNISKNIIHKERFYTSHQVYDRNNIFNQIIAKALNVIIGITSNHRFIPTVRDLQLSFEDVDDINVTEKTFDSIRFNRNTECYRTALLIAKMIILNYSPDIKNGENDILAILFDMNMLFEKFIYFQIKKEEINFKEYDLSISGQESKAFWQGRRVRPDIIAEFKKENKEKRIVLDTKWKVVTDDTPSDDDLKQMYVYNLHFDSPRSILLYPKVGNKNRGPRPYENSDTFGEEYEHFCQMLFVELFDADGKKKQNIGKKIIDEILNHEENKSEHTISRDKNSTIQMHRLRAGDLGVQQSKRN